MPHLIVRRIPYEEPYHTQLHFQASNGVFAGAVDLYCNVSDLSDIGDALVAFPRYPTDEFLYGYGSDNPEHRSYRRFIFRAYTTDSKGHCAIQVAMNLNETEPDEGICTFSIPTEPTAIMRLGQLFQTFAKLQHLELHWSPDAGRLYETWQDAT